MCDVRELDKMPGKLTETVKSAMQQLDEHGHDDHCVSLPFVSACKCYGDLCNHAHSTFMTSYSVLLIAITSLLVYSL